MPFLIAELAALVAVFILVGCVIGFVIRRMKQPATEQETIIVAAALSQPAAQDLVQAEIASSVSAESVTSPEPVTISEAVDESISESSNAIDSSADSQSESETELGRPERRTPPKRGKLEDLTLIQGIGNAVQSMLHAQGIYYFEQIAQWSADEVQWIETQIAFPGRVTREAWIEQAAKLMAAKPKPSASKGMAATKKPATDKPKRKKTPKAK